MSEEIVVIKEDTTVLDEEKEKSNSKAKSTAKKRGKKLSTAEEIRFSKNYNRFKDNIFVVFVECESSGNVGFLARAMANFGLENLILINPCNLKEDAYYQAMHAKYIVENAVANTYPNLDDFLKKKEIDFIVGSTGTPGGSYNLSRIPIKPEELGKSINLNKKIALIFGREGNGLYNEEIEMCDIIVSIPTEHSYPIMNISHAAAIIFYELFKNRNEFPVEGLEEATRIEKEYLLKDMEDIIKKLNIPEHKEKTGIKSFKNIINRAFITGREAHTLKGILRRILMKFE
ncbi:MAG: TrmJ/YjtD family RNA methyltransferase [Methanobrevibacter arboriphilus]|uniref:TrmJ/YjtD family RNA methyltransferase n=1 Tax=Methanobrevibacter arboriphilus TaxID=39441 RepID=A0A843AET1_METAZ|nr:TrmJ/YjtD family RNA methyltransferase [Methanobrevibacter arboriphilus]MBF4468281.1 TrmJ/YjtD family RNA methyltransferase [Methanobrevibacter arboriphilus]